MGGVQFPGFGRQRLIPDPSDVQSVGRSVCVCCALRQLEPSASAGLATNEHHHRLPARLSTPRCANRRRFAPSTRGPSLFSNYYVITSRL